MTTPNRQRLVQDSGYALITRERTDKLDLLQHLTANLARTVIVCGPEGVGKTRLLDHFKGAYTESSLLCVLKGDSNLSLEKIQASLSEAIAEKIPGFKVNPLSGTLEILPSRDAFVLLLIDDAGKLAPGVMGQIISYAGQYPALRIVFALTHSELYLKNGTDPAIDDCYQIEIPALTELQCADFLEYLSTLPSPRIDFNAINEVFVANLYRDTHGIPGKILEKLPQPNNTKKLDYSSPILIGAVIALIAIALGVQWWSSRPKPVAQIAVTNRPNNQAVTGQAQQTPVQQQPVAQPTQPGQRANQNLSSTVSNAAISGQQSGENPAQAPQQQNPVTTNTARNSATAGQKTAVVEVPPAQTSIAAQSAPVAVQQQPLSPIKPVTNVDNPPPVPAENLPNLDEGGKWVMAQPAENVTLQLMALPDQQAIIGIMQKHQELGQNLKMLKTTTKRGKDRFVLLYGSFANAEQASLEAKNLPNELRKTWARKMNSIQAELNPAPPASTSPPPHPSANALQ